MEPFLGLGPFLVWQPPKTGGEKKKGATEELSFGWIELSEMQLRRPDKAYAREKPGF